MINKKIENRAPELGQGIIFYYKGRSICGTVSLDKASGKHVVPVGIGEDGVSEWVHVDDIKEWRAVS